MGAVTAGSRVVGFGEALEAVLGHAAGVRAAALEQVALLASAGRVLAEEVVADRDQPPFDRAARDGFAVRAGEWSAGTRLRVNHTLTLRLAEGSGVFAGESVTRRLDRLAQALGLEATTELAA